MTTPAAHASSSDSPRIEGITVSRWRRIVFLSGSVAIGVFAAFNNFTLSSWLFGLTSSFFLISIFGNSKSFEGAILSPVVGALSDKTWLGWLGRRRPYVLLGGLLSGLILGFTPQITRTLAPWAGSVLPAGVTTIASAVFVIFLFTLTFNLMDDQYRTLLPDLFAEDDRNRMSSYMVVAEFTAQMMMLFVFAFLLQGSDVVPDWTFAVAGIVVAIGCGLVVLGIKEPPPETWRAGRQLEERGAERSSPWSLLRRFPSAAIFLVSCFAYWAGVNAVLPLITVYVETILGADKGIAQLVPALLVLSTLIVAVPSAYLGSKVGKRWVIGAGYVIMAAAAIGGLLITTIPQGAVLFLVAGIGNGGVVVLTLPLFAALVPRTHMGAAVGLLAAASSIAAPLSSIVGGTLSDLWGPRTIFWVMFGMVSFALVLLFFVHEPASDTAAGDEGVP
jgi:Na+/melibiose symporter-like transporter